MKIAVLTGGGDAPGMNAAIRAVARAAFAGGWEVVGVEDGYRGLTEGHLRPLDDRTVAGILNRGGTVLGTARSEEFKTAEGQRRAVSLLEKADVGGIVIVGGDGSMSGGLELGKRGVPVVGVPATIDNDVWGTDTAVGVDTALNTALESIDRIKDTASSHRRSHVVEVMGRHCGYLALMAALAGGAEAVLVPEFETDPERLLRSLKVAYERGKRHFIVVVAEGSALSAQEFHEYINAAPGTSDSRLTVLGYVQRGGSPTAFDRTLASRLGARAVETLTDGEVAAMVGLQGRRVERVPLEEVAGKTRPLDPEMYGLAEILAGLPETM